MDLQQLKEAMSKAEVETSDVVRPERRGFLNAAFLEHLGAEMAGDVPAIVATFAKDGHLSFNGVCYDTPERLTAFHKDFGWDGHGMLSDIGGEIVRLLYTPASVVVDYLVRAHVQVALGDAPAGRAVAFPMCVIYRFAGAGKLLSERGSAESGGLRAQPVRPLGPW